MKSLLLSDVTNNSNDIQEFNNAISPDGKFVYITHIINPNVPPSTSLVIAELFENVDGKLISIKQLSLDPNFPIISSGCAARNFQLFAILDIDNRTTNILGQGRLRLFDLQFNQVGNPFIFNDVNIQTLSLNVSKFSFSFDNHYLVVSYINSTDPQHLTGVTKLLDISNPFNIIVTSTVPFNGFSNGASFFELSSYHSIKSYLIIPSTNAIGSTFTSLRFVAPAQIQIFRILKNGLLRFLDSTFLPQLIYAAEPFNYKCTDKTYIIVTNQVSFIPGHPVPFDSILTNATSSGITPFPPFTNDNTQLHIFQFTRRRQRLKLIINENINTSVRDIAWYPNGKFFLASVVASPFVLSQTLPTNPLVFFSIVQPILLVLYKFNIDSITTLNEFHVGPTAPSNYFSANGSWLIVGGGSGVGAATDIVSTSLYKVIN